MAARPPICGGKASLIGPLPARWRFNLRHSPGLAWPAHRVFSDALSWPPCFTPKDAYESPAPPPECPSPPGAPEPRRSPQRIASFRRWASAVGAPGSEAAQLGVASGGLAVPARCHGPSGLHERARRRPCARGGPGANACPSAKPDGQRHCDFSRHLSGPPTSGPPTSGPPTSGQTGAAPGGATGRPGKSSTHNRTNGGASGGANRHTSGYTRSYTNGSTNGPRRTAPGWPLGAA
jgi:hypothetical protein